MARLGLALLIIVFVLIHQVPSMQSRNPFNADMKAQAALIPPKDNLVPSDHVPMKPPTDKDHVMANTERLFALHLAKIDRLLQSVPSPGGGN
ncbi:Detected protein of unknown function [Hibiscus syriacus]|uniref:Uncharacterized protein n=1 Tax=Hibiscus syriacus TaxID=106335 RepID=A0A6A3B7Q2_HIBSY|nr:Detected protein of unknown function [Hibiscus syriacus]